MIRYRILIPAGFPDMPLKTLLEDYFLIPRKIRHFLRTKKHVHINGQAVNWQSPVSPGDCLELTFDAEDYPQKTLPLGQADLVDILYQDEHIVVVNKPEGMKTHGNHPTEIALLNHVSAAVGCVCYVVHRLDQETSGAILFAKNPFILPILNRLLEEKRIFRTYLALCQGRWEPTRQRLTEKIGRHRHDRRKRVVDPKNGQTAETLVAVECLGKSTSLLSCTLKTGRTHQIRVHLAYHGHPIVGDPLYGTQKTGRLMLHASSLTFQHPFTLETIHVSASSTSFKKELQGLEGRFTHCKGDDHDSPF